MSPLRHIAANDCQGERPEPNAAAPLRSTRCQVKDRLTDTNKLEGIPATIRRSRLATGASSALRKRCLSNHLVALLGLAKRTHLSRSPCLINPRKCFPADDRVWTSARSARPPRRTWSLRAEAVWPRNPPNPSGSE